RADPHYTLYPLHSDNTWLPISVPDSELPPIDWRSVVVFSGRHIIWSRLPSENLYGSDHPERHSRSTSLRSVGNPDTACHPIQRKCPWPGASQIAISPLSGGSFQKSALWWKNRLLLLHSSGDRQSTTPILQRPR